MILQRLLAEDTVFFDGQLMQSHLCVFSGTVNICVGPTRQQWATGAAS